jgi:hypothetical protein
MHVQQQTKPMLVHRGGKSVCEEPVVCVPCPDSSRLWLGYALICCVLSWPLAEASDVCQWFAALGSAPVAIKLSSVEHQGNQRRCTCFSPGISEGLEHCGRKFVALPVRLGHAAGTVRHCFWHQHSTVWRSEHDRPGTRAGVVLDVLVAE